MGRWGENPCIEIVYSAVLVLLFFSHTFANLKINFFQFLIQEELRWIVSEEGKISNASYFSLQKAFEKLSRQSLTNFNYVKEEVASVVMRGTSG